MKVQTIKNTIIDQYGYKYMHNITVRTGKNKKIVSETVSVNGKPLFKMTLNNNKFRAYDMGLFGKFIERK